MPKWKVFQLIAIAVSVHTVTVLVMWGWHSRNCGMTAKTMHFNVEKEIFQAKSEVDRQDPPNSFEKPGYVDNSAKQIERKIRLLCWFTTEWKDLNSRARAVYETWGKRCDKLIIVLSKQIITHSADNLLQHILMVNTTDGRIHLTAKSKEVFTYIHSKYLNHFDWFLKADHDSYFIIENLKYFLSRQDTNVPLATGRYFKEFTFNGTGYLSGGAGYVINGLALDNLVVKGFQQKGLCTTDGGSEDVEIGICLAKTGTRVIKSIDSFSRQTFNPNSILRLIVGDIPSYLYTYDRHKVLKGTDCCSQLSISFHYIDPALMRAMEFLIYRLSVYGYKQDPHALEQLLKPELEKPIPPIK